MHDSFTSGRPTPQRSARVTPLLTLRSITLFEIEECGACRYALADDVSARLLTDEEVDQVIVILTPVYDRVVAGQVRALRDALSPLRGDARGPA